MAKPPVQHSDLRKAGLAAALVVGLIVSVSLTVVIITRRSGGANTALPPTGVKPHQPVEPGPDIADKGLSTGTARVQFADRADPSRAAGMIEWSKLEPLSQVEKLLTNPRGYVYLRDGGLIVVSSQAGRLNTAPRLEEPQSGRFEGGVTLHLYPSGYDPKLDKPTLTATTDTLDFDFPSASIAATGSFIVRSTKFDISGKGMRMVANQIEEGIERFEVAHVNNVTIRPDAQDPKPAQTLVTSSSTRPPLKQPGPDRLRTYRAVVDGDVRLNQSGRLLTADRMEAWASLINNRIPVGAVGKIGPDTPVAARTSSDPNATATSSPLSDQSTITANWSGKLVVLPVTDGAELAKPRELAGNQVALRLHAGTTPVTIQDPQAQASVEAARIDIGATQRTLALASTPANPVRIHTADAGSATCQSATINLGTGLASLTGPGSLLPAPGAPVTTAAATPEGTTLAFDESLDLRFATRDNWIDKALTSALISGGFNATSGQARVSAENAQVTFGQPIGPQGKQRTPINTIVLSGNALASVPAAQRPNLAGLTAGSTTDTPATDALARDTLQGDSMTVTFTIDGITNQERPAKLAVNGNAVARSGGQQPLTLQARTINATLGLDKEERTVVTAAEALDDVRLSDTPEGATPRPGDTTAACQRLTIDPAAGIATLYGSATAPILPVTVTRDGATMTGPRILLTQADGTLYVDGPGTVSKLSDGDEAQGIPYTSAFAAWSTSMLFDNNKGTATCTGNATAIVNTGGVEQNTLTADTVVLNFTPAAKATDAVMPQQAPRELAGATATGILGIDGAPPRPATLEHKRFAPGGGDNPRVERLAYLQGHVITADQKQRTLTVPVAGKLLIDDRTPDPEPRAATSQPSPVATPQTAFNQPPALTSAKGTSLFTWQQSMSFSMNSGVATLKEDVQLTHQPLPPAGSPADAPAPPQTTLDCDTLTAVMRIRQSTDATAPSQSIDGTLESIEARGHVLAKSDNKTLLASLVSFNAVQQLITAAAGPDTMVNDDRLLVSYLDPARSAPIQARKILWDQKTGEIRIIEPAPTQIGR